MEPAPAAFGFAPVLRPDGGPSLHGMTHAEVTRVIFPDRPEEHSDIVHLRWVDLRGPHGNLTGYVETAAFDAVCAALGVREIDDGSPARSARAVPLP
jgi:hypothetical protein